MCIWQNILAFSWHMCKVKNVKSIIYKTFVFLSGLKLHYTMFLCGAVFNRNSVGHISTCLKCIRLFVRFSTNQLVISNFINKPDRNECTFSVRSIIFSPPIWNLCSASVCWVHSLNSLQLTAFRFSSIEQFYY